MEQETAKKSDVKKNATPQRYVRDHGARFYNFGLATDYYNKESNKFHKEIDSEAVRVRIRRRNGRFVGQLSIQVDGCFDVIVYRLKDLPGLSIEQKPAVITEKPINVLVNRKKK